MFGYVAENVEHNTMELIKTSPLVSYVEQDSFITLSDSIHEIHSQDSSHGIRRRDGDGVVMTSQQNPPGWNLQVIHT